MFSPINHQSKSQEIFNQLRRHIENKTYKEHEKLPPEKELCEMFGVSRQPVREALKSLKAIGYIVSKQGEGSFVTYNDQTNQNLHIDFNNLSQEAYFDLVELRHIIEVHAAELCAIRRDAEDLFKIKSALQTIKDEMSTQDTLGFEADYAFHEAVMNGSKNRYLIETFNHISDIYKVGMKFSLSLNIGNHQKRTSVIKEHEAIYQAIVDQDSQKSSTMMDQHIRTLRIKMGDQRIL